MTLNVQTIKWDFVTKIIHSKSAVTGLVIVIMLVFMAISAPYISPFSSDSMDFSSMMSPPGVNGHLIGTDQYGRDIFTRILYGSRISLMVGIIAVGIGASFGILLGVIAGYFGGVWDALIMRVVDAMLSFPYILLAIAMMAVLGPGLFNAMLAIGIVMTPNFARIVRGNVLSIKEEEFIVASKILGASNSRVIVSHVLPNILHIIIVYGSLNFAGAIISEATLSFLGIGIQPPTPSWGSMLRDAQSYLQVDPYMSIFPGTAILISSLGFNLLGDGLRDILDPRLNI
jgi:peptide/nickel transport system permease protein